jgi:hypothetical protein
MTMDYLQVRGNQIVDSAGKTVRLRGASVGGWMNMEDFINGHSGSEHMLRITMGEALGERRATFFFERLLAHFFNASDIHFMKTLGFSVIRLPLNYRHFENDDNPFHYVEQGFHQIDTVLDWCEREQIYVILDLHAVQGWQNVHWHSDNNARQSLFWDHLQFQDRFVGLWEEFARRYKNRAVVAGFNLMNEPCVGNPHGDFPWNIRDKYNPNWSKINKVYRRVVSAIRAIDTKHIIFVEGDNYSRLFDGLDEPFSENMVYSSHNYTPAGFGPGRYPGYIKLRNREEEEFWDINKQEDEFFLHQGTQFCQRYNVPLWVGEFGSVYNGPRNELADRFRALKDQIGIYEKFGAHWTLWTYKDVGIMGLVTVNPESEYIQRLAEFFKTKYEMNTDDWMTWITPGDLKNNIHSVSDKMVQSVADLDVEANDNRQTLSQLVLANYSGALLQRKFVRVFKGLNEVDIDRVLSSFSFEKCVVNDQLTEVVRQAAISP